MKSFYFHLFAAVTLAIIGATNLSAQESAPYLETFEADPLGATGCNPVYSFTVAPWTNETGDDLDWTVDEGGTSSTATGPSVDHTLGTAAGNYLYVETSCPSSLSG
ncbi:MAG: hypothetical protein V3V10_01070 [Planctomycetota bacterium]